MTPDHPYQIIDGEPPKMTAEERKFAYTPHGAARELFDCQDFEVLIEGPAGTGKTRAIWEKLHYIAGKYPGCRILACRKTRVSMTASVLVTFERDVVPPGHSILPGPGRAGRTEYVYPNGSVIVLGGLDNPERLFSSEYDIVAVFEATELTEDDWEKFFRAMRSHVVPYQQVIADCNPSYPSHWLNQRANTPGMTRLLSRHADNPFIDEHPETLDNLKRFTGTRRIRMFEGKWAAVEGQVYTEWDATEHLIKPFPIPKEWRRVRSIDFGVRNPTVCQWWALDGDDRAYLYRELYKSETLLSDIAKQIEALSEGEYIEGTVADHQGQERLIMQSVGLPTIAAKKDIPTGLEKVREMLRIREDGRPGLFIMRDCLVDRDGLLVEARRPWCTEQEIEAYVHAKTVDGRPIKEEPVKKDDHGMDAMRYFAMYINPVIASTLTLLGEKESKRPARAVEDEAAGEWLSVDNDDLFG